MIKIIGATSTERYVNRGRETRLQDARHRAFVGDERQWMDRKLQFARDQVDGAAHNREEIREEQMRNERHLRAFDLRKDRDSEARLAQQRLAAYERELLFGPLTQAHPHDTR